MSFLKKLFRKKPGGSFMGNVVRVVAKAVSGGALGSGKNKIPKGGGTGIEPDPHQWDENNVYETEALTGNKPTFWQSVAGLFTTPEGESKPFNLNDYITLPTVQTNSTVAGSSLLKIAGVAVLIILAYKFIINGRHSHKGPK